MTTRTEQNRLAQQARRDKLKAQGLKPLTVWIPKGATDLETMIRHYAKVGRLLMRETDP